MPEHLLLETRDRVGILRINRPQRLNALNDQLAREICDALFANDANDAIGCSVIMGSDKAFAAGADIGAMADWNYAKVYGDDYITKDWEGIRRVRKPATSIAATPAPCKRTAVSTEMPLPTSFATTGTSSWRHTSAILAVRPLKSTVQT